MFFFVHFEWVSAFRAYHLENIIENAFRPFCCVNRRDNNRCHDYFGVSISALIIGAGHNKWLTLSTQKIKGFSINNPKKEESKMSNLEYKSIDHAPAVVRDMARKINSDVNEKFLDLLSLWSDPIREQMFADDQGAGKRVVHPMQASATIMQCYAAAVLARMNDLYSAIAIVDEMPLDEAFKAKEKEQIRGYLDKIIDVQIAQLEKIKADNAPSGKTG